MLPNLNGSVSVKVVLIFRETGSEYSCKWCYTSGIYKGELSSTHISEAINELEQIKQGLAKLSPDKVIWDIENLSAQPPWGTNISKDITNLSNYFVTSDGEDFITVFYRALGKAKELNYGLKITSI